MLADQGVRDNEALLLSLGLVTPTRTLPLKSRPALLKRTSNTSAKRQRPTKPDNDLFTPDTKSDQISDDEETPSKKVRKTPKTPVQDPIHDSGARRSLRSSARKSYVELKENDVTTASPSAFRGKAVVSVDSDDDEGGDRVKMRNNKPLGKRTEDPYVTFPSALYLDNQDSLTGSNSGISQAWKLDDGGLQGEQTRSDMLLYSC